MKVDKFKDWLRRCGAEILAPTNQYELVRFRARGSVHIVYTGRRGVSMQGFAHHCYTAFEDGANVDMGLTRTPRGHTAERKQALLARDGRYCFYCRQEMPNDDITIEHLIPLDKRGPDHEGNMVLAHARCNQAASNLPLIAKINLRERMEIK